MKLFVWIQIEDPAASRVCLATAEVQLEGAFAVLAALDLGPLVQQRIAVALARAEKYLAERQAREPEVPSL